MMRFSDLTDNIQVPISTKMGGDTSGGAAIAGAAIIIILLTVMLLLLLQINTPKVNFVVVIYQKGAKVSTKS